MDWKTFAISLFGSGVIAAFVTAIVNGLMNHRTQIKAIRESGLYAKRAEVLDELMKRMERLDRIMGELVSPIQFDGSDDAEKERRKNASGAFNYLIGYYKRNRHYLSKELSDKIGNLCDEYRGLFSDFHYEARPEGEQPNVKKWHELTERYKKDFADKKEDIAEEFRKIIGVK